ncbi:MAG: pyruvate/oxaloacetate carboxyltransferase [Deltaproteobacteria bacterium]|nr:pyruvate/oxaloacetate carboxyltransferase [Candidatus Anaeroferrophillacea bacterium]
MAHKVLITDTVLRDAHQSLLATRMRTKDMLPIASKLDKIGYWSLEVWGGATFDSCLRFLKEDPWDRLRALREAIPNTRLQMLLRGQNILGYRHYADDVLETFVERAAVNGIDVFRIFDALNDPRNMRTAMESVKKAGKIAEAAVSYTISPVHSNEYFVNLAKELVGMGADTICIKDMAGLLSPYDAYALVKAMKETIDVPIHLHCHCTSGMAHMTYLKAVEAGVDIVDCAISAVSQGTSQPPTESLVAALKGTGYDTGLELEPLAEVAEYIRDVRGKYQAYESGFTGVDTNVLIYQVPGGMMSNLESQLRAQGAIAKLKDVLAEIPRVRKDFGYPPLVTPSSQIVGTQATINVLTGKRYMMIPTESKNVLKGMYGRSVAPFDPEVQKLALKNEEPITCRPADLIPPEMDKLRDELGDKAKSVEDVLSYALFPKVALQFFAERESGEFVPEETLPTD